MANNPMLVILIPLAIAIIIRFVMASNRSRRLRRMSAARQSITGARS